MSSQQSWPRCLLHGAKEIAFRLEDWLSPDYKASVCRPERVCMYVCMDARLHVFKPEARLQKTGP